MAKFTKIIKPLFLLILIQRYLQNVGLLQRKISKNRDFILNILRILILIIFLKKM